jgi:hypothetical protein
MSLLVRRSQRILETNTQTHNKKEIKNERQKKKGSGIANK